MDFDITHIHCWRRLSFNQIADRYSSAKIDNQVVVCEDWLASTWFAWTVFRSAARSDFKYGETDNSGFYLPREVDESAEDCRRVTGG